MAAMEHRKGKFPDGALVVFSDVDVSPAPLSMCAQKPRQVGVFSLPTRHASSASENFAYEKHWQLRVAADSAKLALSLSR